MGRRRLSVELIRNKKVRYSTYIKRKKCLKKKIDDLSTLCGTKVGMIVYGPKKDCDSSDLDIWPEDPQTIRDLIVSYKSQTSEFHRTRTCDVYHYFWNLKKKAQGTLVKLRKQNNKAKYPTWEDSYDNLSEQQLREFDGILSRRVEALKKRKCELMKGGQGLAAASVLMDSTYGQPNQNYSYSIQNLLMRSNIQLEVSHGQLMPPTMASDVNLPVHRTMNQVHPELPLNSSSVLNPFMMMLVDCNNYSQFGIASNSSSEMMSPLYFDPMLGMPGNMIVNNPMPLSCYHNLIMPPMLQDMPQVMMPGPSSQTHASKMAECNEVGDCKFNHKG